MTGEAPVVLHLHSDGACSGNPGPAAAAWLVLEPTSGEVLVEEGKFLGEATNNVAEYTAIVRGLEACLGLTRGEVRVLSDSQLCVRQLNGEYRVKDAKLKPLYGEIMRIRGQFKRVEFIWVGREIEWTARCDKLAKGIIVEHTKRQA